MRKPFTCRFRHSRLLLLTFVFNLFVSSISFADNSVQENLESHVLFQLEKKPQGKYGYRIPAVVLTNKGTLLAFCERRIGLHDHAENDIVLRRSMDGGKTWEPLEVVREEGGDSLNDPCVVVLDSGRILLRYTRFPKGVHARISDHTVIADTGYDGPKNVRIYLTHSDDDGLTWSEPEETTKSMRPPEAISLGSPGIGIQLKEGTHKGRIIFPNYEVYHIGNGQRTFANRVSYSDDGGKTWLLSAKVPEPDKTSYGDESQIVELPSGRLLMSVRDKNGSEYRKLSLSNDGGQTWVTHRRAKDLVTPPCMSSVIRYQSDQDQTVDVLFHSLPNSRTDRKNGTIFLSRDQGNTWRKVRVIEPGDFAYSCLVQLEDGDVGCLYETDDHATIKFVKIPIDSLLNPKQ